MIDESNDPLKNGGIVLGIWVYYALQSWISFSFVHLVLNIHYLFEDIINVCLDVFDRIEEYVHLFLPELNHAYLYESSP